MKYLLVVFFAIFFWSSCQNNPEPKNTEAPETTQSGSAATDQNENPANGTGSNVEPVKNTALVGMKTGVINGTNVTIRMDATVKSEKTGTFDSQEVVEILEPKNVQNAGEAILSKPITVKGSGGTVNLPKGKAVVIEDYQPDRKTYMVQYEDPKKGNLTAQIDASIVETLTYATWYKVKRKNGETGWVLGKFLKI